MGNTMLSAVYGTGEVQLVHRPIPELRHPRDAIVRVTKAAICTSDLHILNGAVPQAAPGIILGHEFVGEIVALGEAVETLRPGMRVAASCETFCGECFFCRRGYVNNCERGGWKLGCQIDGCQAEYVRVPFADTGLSNIPDGVSDEQALLVGDILSSGYFGAELCEIEKGDTVAILGAGPVGICAALCVKQLPAVSVVLIDIDQQRLNFAAKNGVADFYINSLTQDVAALIRAKTEGRGADRVIEAAGGETTFETAWQIARPNAVVALIAMYEKAQVLPLPEMYGKNLTFKTGGVDACHCGELLELIKTGTLDPSFLITHRFSLREVEHAYDLFQKREEFCLKIEICP